MSIRGLICLALFAVASWNGAAAAAIKAKAVLAQHLLQRAWQQRQAGEPAPRPWPWADTWPVARLHFDSAETELIVLSDASGRSLAFGPGLAGGVLPGQPGNAVLAGHRDTHFTVLRELSPDDRFEVELPDGTLLEYGVTEVAIVDSRDTRLNPDPGEALITLVTCYPFDSPRAGGPLRYVVIARRSDDHRIRGPALLPDAPGTGQTGDRASLRSAAAADTWWAPAASRGRHSHTSSERLPLP